MIKALGPLQVTQKNNKNIIWRLCLFCVCMQCACANWVKAMRTAFNWAKTRNREGGYEGVGVESEN